MRINFLEVGNFRKLLAVRIGLAPEKTVFVGANNSGKTSAMVALRYFLVERERSKFSLNDFTLSHWPKIDSMGREWEASKALDKELPKPKWSPVLPFLDVWLDVEKSEAHFVQELIPTLDWNGGLLGVRLRLEPKDAEQLQKDYLSARGEAQKLEAADKPKDDTQETEGNIRIVLWPKSLSDFLQRRFTTQFTVKSYLLDPSKISDPLHSKAKPQDLSDGILPIEGEPFKGLIRIDEIGAQRGFGNSESPRNIDDDSSAAGVNTTRRMSDQLRRYWNKHLDPFENPDPKDIDALKAIDQAQQAFDERLRAGFSQALAEIEGLGYPGVTDPRLKISTRLKPVDGLNHDTAVQYMIPLLGGESSADLNLPEDSNGLGYQNLISMVFRLMSFRDAWMRVGKANHSTNDKPSDTLIPPLHIVLIEEPEAHLHTQVQQVFIRQAYKILRNHKSLENSVLSTQMVVSTHSSHIAHECEFEELRYFRRLPANEKLVPVSNVVDLGTVFGTDVSTKRFVTRYIKVTHCDLFFADAAVLIEGPAERILVPFFILHNKVLKELHESYITWLEIGGSHAHRLKSLIENLGLTTLVITDLDAKDSDNKRVPPARGKGLKSRNSTLSTWWPENDDLDVLLDLKSEKKSKDYSSQQFSMRVAYQCPIEVEIGGKNVEALTNTLEDALVMQNLDFFAKAGGTGLFGKFKSAISESKTVEELSSKLLKALEAGGKAEFALALLEIEEPEKLEAPTYILEGLKWLTGQLLNKQRELGVATSAATTQTSDLNKSS